jgi:hypothetical protein
MPFVCTDLDVGSDMCRAVMACHQSVDIAPKYFGAPPVDPEIKSACDKVFAEWQKIKDAAQDKRAADLAAVAEKRKAGEVTSDAVRAKRESDNRDIIKKVAEPLSK